MSSPGPINARLYAAAALSPHDGLSENAQALLEQAAKRDPYINQVFRDFLAAEQNIQTRVEHTASSSKIAQVAKFAKNKLFHKNALLLSGCLLAASLATPFFCTAFSSLTILPEVGYCTAALPYASSLNTQVASTLAFLPSLLQTGIHEVPSVVERFSNLYQGHGFTLPPPPPPIIEVPDECTNWFFSC